MILSPGLPVIEQYLVYLRFLKDTYHTDSVVLSEFNP